MSNFIRYALSALGYYTPTRTVLATLACPERHGGNEPHRDPFAPVAANPPLMPTSASFADDSDDDAFLAALAAELWIEEEEDADV